MDEQKQASAAAEPTAKALADADSPGTGCTDCLAAHERALLREVQLRHDAEGVSLKYLAARDQALELVDKANADLLVAIVERDMRVKDEALRAQRVDVEALRAKVLAMKKNLAAVDSRADERFAAQLKSRDLETETRIAAVRAEVAPALAELDRVRAGEQARVEALNAALELIWAKDRRDKGAPRNDRELVVELTRVLSAARLHAQ
jgi:hypothetical protein